MVTFDTNTNMKFLHKIKKEDDSVGPRISLVFRTIDTFVTIDDKGNKMRIIQFNHPDAGIIRYYNCFCPTTKREYYLGTEEKTCIKAKNKSFCIF